MSGDTIFALATPAGKSGVAVFRLSGPRAAEALQTLTGKALPTPRVAVKRRLYASTPEGQALPPLGGRVGWGAASDASIHRDAPLPTSPLKVGGEEKIPLDDALVLYFKAPASFTGEDVVELHTHGGPAIIAAVAKALTALDLRLAEPGEFTRRAFDHGKLDLVEIEGLADLIAAETEAQRRQALRQAEGELSSLYESWRGPLISALARMEAAIDFPDEDLPDGLMMLVDETMRILSDEIEAHLADNHRGEMLRDGLSVAIIGSPNVGKSSLLNRLAGREAAIVSARAGTTRDVIEVKLDLGGYPVLIADTAGLRESPDEIEQEGVKRALKRAEHADLKLIVFDGAVWPDFDATVAEQIDAEAIVVLNKAEFAVGRKTAIVERDLLLVSAKTGEGLDALVAALTDKAAKALNPGAQPALTRLRHRAALERCLGALRRGLHAPVVELKAEDLRLAVQALGRITGRVEVDDVLDLIFREFCIGK
ncbi:tRNA uridine-5-carboxymethylaminomethyl(34) synthesis GTPase MnmE [Dongia rigui]|uniref:tRNA modification GTPase MnmE n=1 Tax=Dongia rigui TaxID=940149 RepID=A0ABU5DXW7_9PROT|nr:tRNA uridine-5-carboxymethylaminomethyl(34) synthesis GTPase MnmE [Dongia rigui]MDY0872153.1 tRNA uridine-5-carboxymethylaminomethyl(34) synthesis GTPase MnmE [Dongia rigui]